MTVYLIRHGATQYNLEKRYLGRTDLPLCAEGRAELHRADFSVPVVYVSPMRRAIETAAILFPEAERVPVEGFREMEFGAFEGRTWKEMEHDADYRAWVDSGCTGRCPGGEDLETFTDRTCAAFESVLEAHFASAGDVPLVVVAHGGTQMALLSRYAMPRESYFHCIGKNGGGFRCETNETRWKQEKLLFYPEPVVYTNTDTI